MKQCRPHLQQFYCRMTQPHYEQPTQKAKSQIKNNNAPIRHSIFSKIPIKDFTQNSHNALIFLSSFSLNTNGSNLYLYLLSLCSLKSNVDANVIILFFTQKLFKALFYFLFKDEKNCRRVSFNRPHETNQLHAACRATRCGFSRHSIHI